MNYDLCFLFIPFKACGTQVQGDCRLEVLTTIKVLCYILIQKTICQCSLIPGSTNCSMYWLINHNQEFYCSNAVPEFFYSAKTISLLKVSDLMSSLTEQKL